MNSKLFFTLMSGLALGLFATVAPADVIYYDNFDPTSPDTSDPLNNSTPTTATGLDGGSASATWVAPGVYTRSGSVTDQPGYSTGAFLPFSPQDGKIYKLSANISMSGGADPSNSWVALGFTGNSNVNDYYYLQNNYAWLVLRTPNERTDLDNQIVPLAGPNTSNVIPPGGSGIGTQGAEYSITLNTMNPSDWVATFSGPGLGTTTYDYGSAITGINYVSFGDLVESGSNGNTLSVDNFSLSTAPEPSSCLLLSLGVLAMVVIYRRRLALRQK